MTGQLRPRTPGLFFVEEWGVSTWKKAQDQPTSATHLRPFPSWRIRRFNVERGPRPANFGHAPQAFSMLKNGGVSTWKKPKFLLDFIRAVFPTNFNQSTNSALVDVWSNSACWVGYDNRCGLQESDCFHIRTLFPKESQSHFRLFRTFSKTFSIFFGKLAVISSPCGVWGRFLVFHDGHCLFLRHSLSNRASVSSFLTIFLHWGVYLIISFKMTLLSPVTTKLCSLFMFDMMGRFYQLMFSNFATLSKIWSIDVPCPASRRCPVE